MNSLTSFFLCVLAIAATGTDVHGSTPRCENCIEIRHVGAQDKSIQTIWIATRKVEFDRFYFIEFVMVPQETILRMFQIIDSSPCGEITPESTLGETGTMMITEYLLGSDPKVCFLVKVNTCALLDKFSALVDSNPAITNADAFDHVAKRVACSRAAGGHP